MAIRFISRNFRILNQLIQPYYCIFCRQRISPFSQLPICQECLQDVQPNPAPYCSCCGRSISNLPSLQNLCKSCLLQEGQNFKSLYPFKYRGVIKKALQKFKYERCLNLLEFFLPAMLSLLKEEVLPFQEIDYISYVPLHPQKLKEREFNQSYLLAKRISASLDIPLLRGLLARIRYTRAQSGLSLQERRRNVAGAFRINPRLKNLIPGSKLLLIDDIITTGSTLRECINEIRKFEAEVIVLTVAGG